MMPLGDAAILKHPFVEIGNVVAYHVAFEILLNAPSPFHEFLGKAGVLRKRVLIGRRIDEWSKRIT
jgi:hypothetical protein